MSTYEALRYNFSGSAITALNGSNIASGTVAEARLADLAASKITSGTFADARFAASNITQHVDLTNLNASNLTSGTVPNARYGTPTFSAANLTDVPSAGIVQGNWTPQYRYGSSNITTTTSFARYIKNGRLVGVFALQRFTGNSGANYNYTRVYISNLPYTAVSGTQFSSVSGHNSGYGAGGGAVVLPGTTQLVLHDPVSYAGRNDSPPIFTNSGTEGAYFDRHTLPSLEGGTFGDSWVYFNLSLIHI